MPPADWKAIAPPGKPRSDTDSMASNFAIDSINNRLRACHLDVAVGLPQSRNRISDSVAAR